MGQTPRKVDSQEIVDRLNVTHDPSNRAAWKRALEAGVTTDICWTLDSAGFKAMMLKALAS